MRRQFRTARDMKAHGVSVRLRLIKSGPDEGMIENEQEVLTRLGVSREELCESFFEHVGGGWYRLANASTAEHQCRNAAE